MTKEQAIKHRDIIIWFLNNSDKGVWAKYKTSNWLFLYEPNFLVGTKYIPNDGYVEFRKALAEGKTIQFDHSIGIGSCPEWKDIDFDLTEALISLLRIKPDEHKFKKDDIIVNNRNGAIGIVDDRDVENGVPITWLTMIEEMPFPRCLQAANKITLWEPKIDSNELLWFWNDGDRLEDYSISTLKLIINDETNFKYKTETGNIHMNCEPFFNNLPINQKHRGKQ